MNFNSPRFRQFFAALLILLAGIAVYANTFQVPFVLDDEPSIVRNAALRDLENFYANTSGYFLPGRCVSYLSFAINYHFGGLDVTGYHAVNLLIHLIAALLVYALLRLTFRTPYFEAANLQSAEPSDSLPGFLSPLTSRQHFVPLFAALLFVVHPIQTQAVTYIVQRMTSLATMFYLLSVVFYILARLPDGGALASLKPTDKKPDVVTPRRVRNGLLIAGAVLAAVLAMLTKPIAFTLPLAVLLYEVSFFRGAVRERLKYLAPLLATLPIVPITILWVRGPSNSIILDVGEQLRVGSDLSRLDYLLTQFRVIVTYLRLLAFPVNQNLDYDHPVYTTFFTPQVFLSFLLLTFVFGLALFLFYATRKTEDLSLASDAKISSCAFDPAVRLIAFGIFWFFLALAVESSLVPIVDVLVEHRLYLPSVGVAAAFATTVFLLAGRLPPLAGHRLLVPVAASLVLVLGCATYQRNHVWGSAVRLWSDVVVKSPNNGRASNNLGVALEKAGRRSEAFEMLARAIEVDPNYYKAYYNLADLYLISDQPDVALPLLQAAIRLQPEFTEAYVKLGAALMRGGNFREVILFLEQNLDRVRTYPEARFYLGAAYVFLGKRQAAMRELEILTQLHSPFAATLNGLLGSKLNHGFNDGSE